MPPRLPAAMLAALMLLAVAALSLSTGPANSAGFTDAAGRRVVLPDRIGRILPAERNAEVLVFVLAPERLAGLEQGPGRGTGLPRGVRPPALGWRPRSNPANMAATARQLRADLIIDAGSVTPDRAAFADAVQQMTGIPYILVDSSFSRAPAVLRAMGAVLGVSERADDLGIYAEHAITGIRGRLLIRPATARPRVYYGLSSDGLVTPLPGAPSGAAIDEAGAINVAAPLGRGIEVAISREQLFAWNPEIIIAERRSFYDALRRNPAWRQLAAVRNKRVYLEPTNPFGWIEDPSGVNRLIGLHWLSSLLYPDATQQDLRSTTCDFYDKFYRIRLTAGQLEALVRPAGSPPPEVMRNLGEPLVGLGAAPASTLPSGAPGAIGVQNAPAPASSIFASGVPAGDPRALCAVPGAAAPMIGMADPVPGVGALPGRSSGGVRGGRGPGER